MESKSLLGPILLLLLSLSFQARADLSDNEIEQSDDPAQKFSDLGLDILGPDYFDESKESSTSTSRSINIEPDETFEEPLIVKKVAPCMGCPNLVDSRDPKIKEMASFAFQEYLASDDGQAEDVAQSFLRVIKAQTQVVAGIKYIMEVELGWTNCSKTEYQADPMDCVLDPTKSTFTCDFHVVEQSWTDNKEVVQSKCYREEAPAPESPPTLSDDDVAVSETEDLPEEPTTESLSEVDDDDDDMESVRRKRDASTINNNNLGKIKDAEEDKATLMEMAVFAVNQLDQVDADNQARLVLDILHAKKQTVSGWLYHLKIRVAQTSCEEGTEITYEKCKDKLILPFQRCDIKVLFQPWQAMQKKVVQSQCSPENYKKSKKLAKKLFKQDKVRETPGKVGGSKVIDPDTEDISELVNFVIDALDAQSNALHAQKLVKVVHAERQLVSGIRTKLILEIGYTGCRKTPTLDKSQCSVDESRDHQFCTITVVEKPWQKERKMVGSKCGTQSEVVTPRTKRGINMFEIPEGDHFDDAQKFGKFVEKYNRTYETQEEYQRRFGIFKDNMRKVKLLQENERGTAIYGATAFADLTEEEFSKRHLGLRPDLKIRMKRKQAKIPNLPKIPDEFDWRHFNAVTPVKNQGSCGSCWAFSVTGNIEGAYKIKHGDLLSFSEQELVDCDTLDEGCNGGLPENAYKSIEKMGGLETETEYPYDGRGDKCSFKSDLAKAKVTGFVEVSKNETDMQAWLLKNGPISIGINANAMQFYFGGVSHPWKYLCSPKNLDHGVLIVGYGVHTYPMFNRTLPYWVVKNSWGANWGEQGYYRVFRGDGTCGVNQMATGAYVA